MLWERVKGGLMILGLGALLVGSVVSQGMAGTSAQAAVQPYTGQIREIKVDQCGLEPGTCEGSLVLAQARGQEVTLAIPEGTVIQRGDQRVHLDELGIGNYVMVQASPLPSDTDTSLGFRLNEPSRDGNRVGTSSGERPVTLRESSEN